jgi:UDP-GlcNAc3NAcA epimerase
MTGSPSSGPVVVIAGIRSQFIKLAAFQRGVARWREAGRAVPELVYVNSGQHYDDELSQQYLEDLDVRIDIDLTGRFPVGDPMRVTGEMLVALHRSCTELSERAGARSAIVFGDANTTLAGAIAARKAGLRVAHVEAGVRTGDRSSSEEINRIVADVLAEVHFASCARDYANLRREGHEASAVLAGDIVRDLVTDLAGSASGPVEPRPDAPSLVTLHREQNTRDTNVLAAILAALDARAERIVLVSHPRTRPLIASLGSRILSRVDVRESMPYRAFLGLLRDAPYVVTDSGAVQREAYYLAQRCLIRQDAVFWPTFLEAGVHRRVGADASSIAAGCDWVDAQRHLSYPVVEDFGDGRAVERILHELERRAWLCDDARVGRGRDRDLVHPAVG